MALNDPLQWVIIIIFLVVIIFGGYLLYRLIRLMNKADKYFDAKAKQSTLN